MTSSSSCTTAPGGLVFGELSVRLRVFSGFLSFFPGVVAVPRAEPRLVTRPNSSDTSAVGLRGLCVVEVVRALENRLGMGGGGVQKRTKGCTLGDNRC
ncbi:hypothetical protein EI94DRAFT_1752934 [Lactarius quietus]|nr:hypothetical protein EI94DRAFT_1752934 [Lactarius quietus]